MKNLRFYLMLPVLVTPFLVLGFWLMGGGKQPVQYTSEKKGLNAHLPEAVNKREPIDKLGAYQAALVDTAKRTEIRRQDPNLNKQKVIREEVETYEAIPTYRPVKESINKEVFADTVTTTPDPEMEAINQALDKLMAIQHPAQEKTEAEPVTPVHSVSAEGNHEANYFGNNAKRKRRKFFDGAEDESQRKAIISAFVPMQQVIKTGSVVKLELNTVITIQGKKVPVGTFLYGYAVLNGERLLVQIPSIQVQQMIIPVSLAVYDLDGLEGIYAPGLTEREVIKESAESAIGSTGFTGSDLSLKTKAASAGIGAMKNLFTKKVKQERVTLVTGYQVVLVDKNANR